MSDAQAKSDFIRFNNPFDGQILTKASHGFAFHPEEEVVIARVVDGAVVGGAIFNKYLGTSMQVHVAGLRPRWISKDLLWICFHYPFVQVGVRKLIGPVNSSNTEAMRFNLACGFKVEAVVKDVYPDGDLNVLSLYREDCRFLDIRCDARRLMEGGS